MKINKFFTLCFIAFILLNISSCRTADEDQMDASPGSLQIKFENGFRNLGNIVLNKTVQTSSSGQKHQFSTLKYIVSGIILIQENGSEFKYHSNDPDKGAFIVDQEQATGGVIYLQLNDIPKGNYKKIRFGLGVSPQAYLLGQNGQGEFWAKAKSAGMAWSWAAGYIFIKVEGKYGTTAPITEFINHAGNMGDTEANGTPNLYREITLELPTTARVSRNMTPSVHILADLNQYLSGQTAILLNAENDNAMGSSPHLVKVADNWSKMFNVDHVHND